MKKSSGINLYLALIHYPVTDKAGSEIASAVTNLDLHDIARVSRTYGVRAFYVVTPLEDQRILARRIVSYWVDGAGGTRNPDRREALRLIRIRSTVEAIGDEIDSECGERPLVVGTTAKAGPERIDFGGLRDRIEEGSPCLLMLGTAWGLSSELLANADRVLDPITGIGTYNHLSVRSAAAIMLDRLVAVRE